MEVTNKSELFKAAMIEQIEKEIQELLESNITSYRIREETGVAQQVIDRYRKGESKIENMSLKVAKKLINFKKSL